MRWAFIAVTFLDQVNLSVTINPYHRPEAGSYQIDTLKVGEYAYLAMSDDVNPIRIGRIEAAEIRWLNTSDEEQQLFGQPNRLHR